MDVSTVTRHRIALTGPFDLAKIATMDFGHRDERSFDGVMRMAFCVDGDYQSQVGVEVRQDGAHLDVSIVEPPGGRAVEPDRILAQVARVVSADHDGEQYARICRADPVLKSIWARAPGFRPALFYSPYEAAIWSILSARRARRQAIPVRERLAEEYGTGFELAGQTVRAVPTPTQLLAVSELKGLPADRVPRLHAIAEAAQRGELSVERLAGMSPDEAREAVQKLPGIGPFYSSLIVVRACGLADVLPDVPHVREAVDRFWGRRFDDAEFAALAEGWRPFRTWVAVMLRAVGEEVSEYAH